MSTRLRGRHPVTTRWDFLVDRFVNDDSAIKTYVNDVVPHHALTAITNALYTYEYRVCVGPATEFYGARFTHQYTDAGD